MRDRWMDEERRKDGKFGDGRIEGGWWETCEIRLR
jgi:hypothetical protein